MNSKSKQLRSRIRWLLGTFILLLVLSGITAFPLEAELSLLLDCCVDTNTTIGGWILYCYQGVSIVNDQFPFISYGTDWLAFGHLVIAMFFIGPYINPVQNRWVMVVGMVACVGVIPLALIAGPIRSIPFFWQMIDCSFGIIGAIPLILSYRLAGKIKDMEHGESLAT